MGNISQTLALLGGSYSMGEIILGINVAGVVAIKVNGVVGVIANCCRYY